MTAAAARSSARSWSRPASSWVIRVRRVPNANASTRRRAATQACMYCSSIRAYGAIEPDTSQTSTSWRGRVRGRPPATVQRLAAGAQRARGRSGAGRACGRAAATAACRRESRVGWRRASRAISSRASAISASVYRAKSFSCSSSTVLHAAGTGLGSCSADRRAWIRRAPIRGSAALSIEPQLARALVASGARRRRRTPPRTPGRSAPDRRGGSTARSAAPARVLAARRSRPPPGSGPRSAARRRPPASPGRAARWSDRPARRPCPSTSGSSGDARPRRRVRHLRAPRARARAATSSWTLSATPSVSSSDAVLAEREQRLGPDDRLPHPGQLVQVALVTQPRDGATTRATIASGTPGRRAWTISRSRSGVG